VTVVKLEMNKFKEEMNGDYSNTVTPVSRGRFMLEELFC
jgi:hypothetical protein